MPNHGESGPPIPSLTHNEQYRLLVEGITDYAIYMLSPDGLVISWNPGAERFKGYQAAEIIGRHFSVFYPMEDRAKGDPEQALETAKRDGRFESEGWRLRKDGSRFWASVVIDPIRSSTGETLGFAKITRDTTQHKEAQRALDETNKALFQAQKMDALGQLTGGVAHDFNNLLTAVLGSLELLRKRVPSNDPKITRLLETATQGAQRGVSLTRRMLAFARHQELVTESVNVSSLMKGVVDLLQSTLGAAFSIETYIPHTTNTIRCDANQLELALLNLALNSRDAMPRGGNIRLSAREEFVSHGHGSNLRLGNYACLAVADSGEGMDEATLQRAIEPFYTTKGPGQGTGLGLSMVSGIAIQSGGQLILKSIKGRGTTAELWFPLGESTTKAAKPLQASAGRLAKKPGPLVILVVDDDALILASVVNMLEDLGHTVLEATSGKIALEILRREPEVDLIVADQAMPHMTGIQLFGVVRDDWPTRPMILASGFDELPPGRYMDLVRLAKPFRQAELAQAIADAIAKELPSGRVVAFPRASDAAV